MAGEIVRKLTEEKNGTLRTKCIESIICGCDLSTRQFFPSYFCLFLQGSLETGNIFSGSTSVYQFLDLVTVRCYMYTIARCAFDFKDSIMSTTCVRVLCPSKLLLLYTCAYPSEKPARYSELYTSSAACTVQTRHELYSCDKCCGVCQGITINTSNATQP